MGAEYDPTLELRMRLPVDFVIGLGGLTPARMLFGLERHWIEPAELVHTLAETHWDEATWGRIARLLPDEFDQVRQMLHETVLSDVDEEQFWKYAAVGYLFRQPPIEATRAELDEVWCGFGHPDDIRSFAPSFEHPLPGRTRRERQNWEWHRGVWAAYLREQAERLGAPVIDWFP